MHSEAPREIFLLMLLSLCLLENHLVLDQLKLLSQKDYSPGIMSLPDTHLNISQLQTLSVDLCA